MAANWRDAATIAASLRFGATPTEGAQDYGHRVDVETNSGGSAQLVGWAEARSEELLSKLGNRWLHVQGVVAKARLVGQLFAEEDRDHLLAAAHLHDVGYAPGLRRTGAHQLDGADYVRSFGHERLACLVAHHSAARYELELRSLGDHLADYPPERSDVTAALIYCDLTTGPTGSPMSLDERIGEVVQRYGDSSLVARALREAHPELEQAVQRISRLLSDRDAFVDGNHRLT